MKSLFQKTLQKDFDRRKQKNSLYSLRAFAKDIKLSPASLSKVFKGYHLHPNSIEKVLVSLPQISEETKKEILEGQTSKNFHQYEIDKIFSKLSLASEYRYLMPDTGTMRVLKRFYNSSETKELSPHFEDNFFSNERQVSCRGYFVKKEDGFYKSYLTENFNTGEPSNWSLKKNENMSVNFDKNGFPQISSMIITVLGSDELIKGNLFYSDREALISEYKYKNEEKKEACEIKYVRL